MELNFKQFGSGFPVTILHGLLGSLDNWQTIAKKLAETNQFSVFIPDQRNHGRSPHTNDFNYKLLSADLNDFFLQQKIEKAHLIGHSMGGKTVMQFALDHSEKVEKLIVVDIAPVAYYDKHSEVFDALFAADVAHVTSREAVKIILREKLRDETTVQFLLKGLSRTADGKNFEWKFNLESLSKNYPQISAAIESENKFEGETLFIKGEFTNYVSSETFSSVEKLFPNNSLIEIIGAGHWVHSEKPKEFLDEVIRFLN